MGIVETIVCHEMKSDSAQSGLISAPWPKKPSMLVLFKICGITNCKIAAYCQSIMTLFCHPEATEGETLEK